MSELSEIDLQAFCAREDHGLRRFESPFVWKGWKYATDGRVLLRLPAPGEPDCDPSGGRVPQSLETTLKPVSGKWDPWPHVEPCDVCYGDGLVACSGCDCGYCSGEGDVDCEKCHSMDHGLSRFGAIVARHYAFLISQLPGVEIAHELHPQGKGRMVRFRFEGGGEGAVMEMQKARDA